MKSRHELTEIMNFIVEYATIQLGSGVHTSRVVRNTRRIGEALGTDVRMSTFQKNAIVSVTDIEDEMHITRVVPIPNLPISFQLNSDLSTLSWEATDEGLTLDDIRNRYDIAITKKRLHPNFVTLGVGLANASFCRLFGGDVIAMAIVFVSTVIGFSIKQWMTHKNIANYIVIGLVSFIASAIASVSIFFDCNANIAIATSPLFLVPGVPLINGFIDIVEGYTLIGMSRLVNALLIIVCIAVGLSISLIIVKNSLI